MPHRDRQKNAYIWIYYTGDPGTSSFLHGMECEAGKKTADICRDHGISSWTFYEWRKQYKGMPIPDARRLKKLEEENRRLKTMVADLSLDNVALKDLLSRKW